MLGGKAPRRQEETLNPEGDATLTKPRPESNMLVGKLKRRRWLANYKRKEKLLAGKPLAPKGNVGWQTQNHTQQNKMLIVTTSTLTPTPSPSCPHYYSSLPLLLPASVG